MLQNNLDPDVAERPDDLVVYGGTGRAARSWDAYHAMIRALTDLGGDETLLVQSGKPVGVLRTHEWAPRVLIANSNLVPEWGTWDEFRRLEHLGLTMYGQMTAGSWIYIGTQGILQGTYECFGAIARKQFGGSLAGTLTVTAGLGGMGGAQPLAVTMNEGVALCIEVDPRVAARLDPDRYHRLARAVFAEMALAGIGVVGEFHYVHHRPDGGAHDDPGAMGKAVVAAARDAGIRLSLLDTLYLHGGLDPASDGGYGPLRPEQARFSDGSAERWADRAEELASAVSGPAVRVGAAVHSVRAVDPPSIKVAADWARERGAPLHFHASEQPAENQQCLDVHGMTPTEVIARAGGLGPGTTLVHATHACERKKAMIGGAGSHCCLCPTTERDLADGTGPSTGLAEAGAGLCLGSDSHATVDILEEARTVELDQRAATHGRGVFSVAALASMATSGGYRSLGWPEGGTPISLPASPIPTPVGPSTPGSGWRSPRTAIRARATPPRCRSASLWPFATWA